MGTEKITLDGQQVETLRELLRSGLKCVLIGLNPTPKSVSLGHYYQGRLGQRLWSRLVKYNFLPSLPLGLEDDAAYQHGFGFADLIRLPTAGSKELLHEQKLRASEDLLNRLRRTGDFPPLVFTFKEPWSYASKCLAAAGYRVYRMPGPYASVDSHPIKYD